MKKKGWLNWVIVAAVLIIAVIVLTRPSSPPPTTTEEMVKCIAEKSTLYVQLGCSHCEDQKELFGDNYQYLNVIDCFYERNKCGAISATPTWIIGLKELQGVQSVETIAQETGCELEAPLAQ